MSSKQYPSVDYIRQALRYEDGKLFWLLRPRDHFPSDTGHKRWNATWAGKEAGCLAKTRDLRWQVGINWILLPRYHIVWALFYGEWPDKIDHKDRNSINDRIENLRLATHTQNMQNKSRYKNNKSGHKGVGFHRGKWRARIRVNGKLIDLGYFPDFETACTAYVSAAQKHFGEFACDGKRDDE